MPVVLGGTMPMHAVRASRMVTGQPARVISSVGLENAGIDRTGSASSMMRVQRRHTRPPMHVAVRPDLKRMLVHHGLGPLPLLQGGVSAAGRLHDRRHALQGQSEHQQPQQEGANTLHHD